MEERIIENINNAEKILIGIGELFEESFEDLIDDSFIEFEKNNPLLAGYEKIEYLRKKKDDPITGAYKNLSKLVENKDYFIVTTCKDDKIFNVGFDNERIVAPCGNFRYLQCVDNCANELLPITNEMITRKEDILCPHCRKKVCFNQISIGNYNENGYIEQWQKYNKWIQKTLNRNLCILELGVGLKFPTVIRWPFEKIAFYNNKAFYYRVHDSLYQITEEIKEKSVSIKADPISFLCN